MRTWAMTPKAKARRRRWVEREKARQAQLYRAARPLTLNDLFVGFGGHRKASPIKMVRGRRQARVRKAVRRMGQKTRKQYLKRRARGAA